MNSDLLSRAKTLSDSDLIAEVKLLAQRERAITVTLIAHLAVLDARRLYLGDGCPSLFAYSTQVLHLSEHAAYGRIETARAARKFPLVLEMLADGSITLTTVGLLASHLTPTNHRDLLEAARHKTKGEVEDLVAQLCPRPSLAPVIRRLSVERGSAATVPIDAPVSGRAPPAGSMPSFREAVGLKASPPATANPQDFRGGVDDMTSFPRAGPG